MVLKTKVKKWDTIYKPVYGTFHFCLNNLFMTLHIHTTTCKTSSKEQNIQKWIENNPQWFYSWAIRKTIKSRKKLNQIDINQSTSIVPLLYTSSCISRGEEIISAWSICIPLQPFPWVGRGKQVFVTYIQLLLFLWNWRCHNFCTQNSVCLREHTLKLKD